MDLTNLSITDTNNKGKNSIFKGFSVLLRALFLCGFFPLFLQTLILKCKTHYKSNV